MLKFIALCKRTPDTKQFEQFNIAVEDGMRDIVVDTIEKFPFIDKVAKSELYKTCIYVYPSLLMVGADLDILERAVRTVVGEEV